MKKLINKNKKIIFIVSIVLILCIIVFNYFNLFKGKVYSHTGDERQIRKVFTSYDEFYEYIGRNHEILLIYDEEFFKEKNLAFISEQTSSSGGWMIYKSAVIFGDTVRVRYQYYNQLVTDCSIGYFYITLAVPKKVINIEY